MYLLYALIATTLLSGTALFLTRSYWLPSVQTLFSYLPLGTDYFYTNLPNSFEGDIESGLSSANFDLAGNVADGDGRAGLDDKAKREILRIMKRRRLNFDEARRVYMEQRFAAAGIGADGRPRDPKFVSFS